MFVALAGFCILIQVIMDSKKIDNSEVSLLWGFAFGFISLSFLIIAGIVSLIANSNQIYDGKNIAKITQFETVYQKRADNLTGKFAHYLAEVYPDHEKDIFNKVKPGDVDIYLAKYPELQASKTITELVGQIRSLNDDVYKQQLARAETLRDMSYRLANPWLIRRFIPEAQAEQTEK